MSEIREDKPQIGVSACLLGHPVRFDGGHKKNQFLVNDLIRHVEFVPVCPETAIGLGTPRPTIRLVGEPEHPRVVGVADPTLDVTRRLEEYAQAEVARLGHLCGFVLKKDSPSCGMERVRVYDSEGRGAQRKGVGAFARVLLQRMPLLPVEEEGRLSDPVLRENFINRVFVYQRWKRLSEEGLTAGKLINFHTEHKYMVMAHSQAAYHRMGRLLGDLKGDKDKLNEIAAAYFEELMTALKRCVNRKRHVNVLQHIMGYLKRRIDSDDKAELGASIEAYRREESPLIVPMTLLRHYFRYHPDDYMARQHYLNPYPESLGLRNQI